MRLPLRLRTLRRAASMRRALAAALLLAVCALPATAFLHIELSRSTPAAGALLDAPPTRLWLDFSAHIEARYTTVALVAPDSTRITLDGIAFDAGSDRAFSVPVPAIGPGTYTVLWRTAGADGHIIEGTYSFAVQSVTAPGEVDSAAAASGHPPGAPAEHAHGAADGAPHNAVSVPDVFARWLHFTALITLLGAIALRVLLLPRLAVDAQTYATLQRRVWRALSFAALALAAAAVLRLWLQSVALHGAERAWSAPLLSMMLTDTSWGRAWLVQAVLFALLGAGIAWARPPRDRVALIVACVAALGLAAIPAMTGHAAGAERNVALVVANDALHVLSAGAWIGALALLMLGILPALLGDQVRAGSAARAVDAFSPIALTAAAVVACTGVINALLHFSRIDELWSSSYGRTLLIKLAFVVLVLLAGAYNWRVVRPRLRDSGDVGRLRRSATAELLFACAVLITTAVLTGLPRP